MMNCTHKDSLSQSELIKNTKNAIRGRKYAHPDEINLLWKNSSKASWLQIMLIACVGSFLLMLLVS
ncbi:3-oxoacyl-ACP synthase [Providencia manganoxydans]|uniref:3-oxoacyl-ACP synthase n=1 Tax=Providencia manganoxydans TaxID=2923283 RepID=UPI0034E3E008